MSAPLKADVVAADRLLKAAVRRAVAVLRNPTSPFDQVAAVDILTAAGECAELLLAERAS